MIGQANGCSSAGLRALAVVHSGVAIAPITQSQLKRLKLTYSQSILWRFFYAGYGRCTAASSGHSY
jgi:hypothetical protein